MEKKYYVYALDTNEGHITAALSCSDEQMAQRTYLIARREFETEYGKITSFHFGFEGVGSQVTIEYEVPPKGNYWRGYLKTETFNRDDFEFAEEQTEKFFSNENKRHFGSYYAQQDIEFLRHAKSAKSKLFLGFDPRDVPADKSENKKPPWKRASSDMKSADNSVMAPSESANDTQATSQPLVKEKPKPKNETAQPKKRRKIRVKKYEVPVAEYLINLREEVLVGIVPSAKVANLTAMDIAECLAKKDEFKNLKIDSIEQKVRRSEAWKKRNETFKPIYDTATFRNRHSGKTPYQDVQ